MEGPVTTLRSEVSAKLKKIQVALMVIDQKADSSITISPAAFIDEIHTIMKTMAGKAVSCFQKSLLPRSSVGGKQRNPCLSGPLDDDH